MQRYLDHLEAPFVRNAGRKPGFTHAIEYRGHVDEDALARAFEILCARDPVLRARIRSNDRGHVLYVPPDHQPQLVALTGDGHTLQEETIKLRDPTRAVVQLVLIRGDQRGYVALIVDHAVVDAHRRGAVFDQLWRIYTDIVNGHNVVVVEGGALPAAPSDLLRQRWGEIPSPPPPPPAAAAQRAHVSEVLHRRICFDRNETTDLLSAAHCHSTSVHALISGAILVAIRQLDTLSEPAPMACCSAVDLRNRVNPPVGIMETTNFIGIHKAVVNVPADGDPITVGREIKTQLDSAIAQKEILTDIGTAVVAISTPVDSPLEPRLAQGALVTNVGIIPRYAQPPGLTITDVVMPSRKQSRGTAPDHAVYTYDGRLTVRCEYNLSVFTPQEVAQLVQHITTILRVVATS